MTRRKRLTTAQRRAIYAEACGDNDYPICNICGRPVTAGQAWDVSHEGSPHALGGTKTGIAHRRCNREHGAKVVTPMAAKAKRRYDGHRGIAVPRCPMAGGRDDPLHRKKTFRHGVVNRVTGEPWRGK